MCFSLTPPSGFTWCAKHFLISRNLNIYQACLLSPPGWRSCWLARVHLVSYPWLLWTEPSSGRAHSLPDSISQASALVLRHPQVFLELKSMSAPREWVLHINPRRALVLSSSSCTQLLAVPNKKAQLSPKSYRSHQILCTCVVFCTWVFVLKLLRTWWDLQGDLVAFCPGKMFFRALHCCGGRFSWVSIS